MKKIIALLLFCFSVSLSFWNRDATFTRIWRTNIQNPLNVTIEIKNIAPWWRTITIPQSNLFSRANLTTIWSCAVSRNSDNVDISYYQTSRWTPPSYINCNFYIDIHQNTLRNYVNDYINSNNSLNSLLKKSEKDLVVDSVSYWLKDMYAVTLKLAVNSNGNFTSSLKAFFPPYRLQYSYYYLEECHQTFDKSCSAVTKNWYDFKASIHEEVQTQTKTKTIDNWEINSSLSAICDNSSLIYWKEVNITNCNDGFVLSGWACVMNTCQWSIPPYSELNWTQDATKTWTHNNNPWECTFKCISWYDFEWWECKKTILDELLQVTPKKINPICSNPLKPQSLPACSDWIDNDSNWKIDYPADSCCMDKNDTSESWCLIQPDHKIPLLEWNNVTHYNDSFKKIQWIDNTPISSVTEFNWTISYFTDVLNYKVSTYFVPIWKVKILENWVDTDWSGNRRTNLWISKFSFTVMNAEWTSPISQDYCRYSWSYVGNEVLRKWQEFVFYLDSRCAAAFKKWKYSLSVEAIDEFGYAADKYSSNNKIFVLNSLLWNVDLTKSQITVWSTWKLWDINECVPVTWTLRDSQSNIIPNRDIVNIWVDNKTNFINEITKSWDPIWISNTTKLINWIKYHTLSTDNQWKFNSCIYSYNKTDNKSTVKLNIDKIEISNNSPFWDKTNSYFSRDYNSVPVFDKLIKYSITWDSQVQIWFDQEIRLNVNNLSNNTLSNAYFKFNLILKSKNVDVTNNFKIIPLDANTTKLLWKDFTNLKSSWFLVNQLNWKKSINLPIKFRLEQVDWTLVTTDLTITWELWIDYSIKNMINNTDTKNVVAIFLPDNDLSAMYWWVKVVWLSSTNSSFFKITDTVWSNVQTTNNFASTSLNTIKQNISNLTRGIEMKSESINLLKEIKWINITSSNINLSWTVVWKSIAYSEGWDIIIKWNILKWNWWLLTIAAIGWRIIIDPAVTEINAILITDKWIFSFESISQNENTTKWLNNNILKNQLLIKWSIITLWNTIWWAINVWWTYFLPMWEKSQDFYKAAFYDLNYLRRYHNTMNKWNFPSGLDQAIYWANPVVIMLDSNIQLSSPYGF